VITLGPLLMAALAVVCTAWASPQASTKDNSMQKPQITWKNSIATLALLTAINTSELQAAAGEFAKPPTAAAPKASAMPAAPENNNTYLPSSDADESAGCKKHLQAINTAIQAYKKDHGDIPNWLNELVPKYIGDTNALICPAAARTGQQSPYGVLDPKVHTSYVYEFTPTALPKVIHDAFGGPEMTMRDWKRQQMKLVDGQVPLVRCLLHDPVLNLSVGGKIYESSVYWELSFTNSTTTLESFYPH
jgi:hypothetical protein